LAIMSITVSSVVGWAAKAATAGGMTSPAK